MRFINLMRLFLGLIAFLPMGWSQTCAPPLTLRPTDSVSGTLDETNCRLTDSTSYAEYALVLPVRGQIQLGGASSDFTFGLILRDNGNHQIAAGSSISQPVERGSYRVLVNAGAAGQSGAFTLTSSFTPQAAIICRGFAAIGLNQTVTGRLTSHSCLLPDATPYDGYTLTSFGAGTLNVTLESDDFEAYLIVRTSDGYALGSADSGGAGASAQLSVGLAANQTYTIVASAGNAGSGAYNLSLSFTPDAGETCRSLSAFSTNGSVQGSISPNTSCVYNTGVADANIFYNYYDLQVTQPGTAEIRLSSKDFSPYLQLLDAAGNLIQGDAYAGGIGNAVVQQQLLPGNYLIQVYSDDNPGAYTLQYTFTPQLAGDVTCPVYAVDSGAVANSSLSTASCRTFEGLSQVYSIVLAQAGTLDIDMQSSDFVPLLTLRDAKDNRIVNDDNFGNITDSHITADLPAGTYSIVATTGGLPGGFALSYQLTPHALAPCNQVQTLNVNSGYIGVFGSGSCRGPNGQPVDYYQVTTPSDGTLAAVMTSPAIDAFLTLQAADGTVLRWDDNSYGGTDAFVVQFLPGQTYRIAARASDAISSGYYRVDMVWAGGGPPVGCAPVSTVNPGDSVQGTLTFTGCQYPDDTFADVYQFTLSDITALDLHLDSPDFDAYLVVLDSKGNVIDEDDNSGGGTNALVSDTFDPGTYYVVAKPFAMYTATGKYTLTLSLSAQ
jgi:hypothetical protein